LGNTLLQPGTDDCTENFAGFNGLSHDRQCGDMVAVLQSASNLIEAKIVGCYRFVSVQCAAHTLTDKISGFMVHPIAFHAVLHKPARMRMQTMSDERLKLCPLKPIDAGISDDQVIDKAVESAPPKAIGGSLECAIKHVVSRDPGTPLNAPCSHASTDAVRVSKSVRFSKVSFRKIAILQRSSCWWDRWGYTGIHVPTDALSSVKPPMGIVLPFKNAGSSQTFKGIHCGAARTDQKERH
jgi:hypothetical protein